MPSSQILHVRMPRLVRGTVKGGRQVDVYAVLDEVPLAVRCAVGGEVPVFMKSGSKHAREGVTEWRVHDGRFYKPLPLGHFKDHPSGLPVEMLSETMIPIYRAGMRMVKDASDPNGQRLHDWYGMMKGGKAANGLVPAEDRSFKSIEDDGRAAQATAAARISDNLLVIDGLIHHRAPSPMYKVAVSQTGVYAHIFDTHWPTTDSASRSERDWNAFPLDDEAGVEAYGMSLSAMVGLPFNWGASGREVVDRQAIVGVEWTCPARQARLYAKEFSQSLSKELSELDDESINAYVRLRAAGRGDVPDTEGIQSIISDIAVVCDAEDPSGHLYVNDVIGNERRYAIAVGRSMLLRFKVVDGPRAGFHDPDMEALEELSLGMAP